MVVLKRKKKLNHKKVERLDRQLAEAVQHHQCGRLLQAQAGYQKVLSIDPQNPDALHLSGVVCYQSGEYEQALDFLQDAIQVNPAVPNFYNNLGIVWTELGRLKKAIQSHSKAVELKPDYADAWNNLGSVHRRLGLNDEAESCFLKAVQIQSDFPEPHYNLGLIYLSREQYESAQQKFISVLSLRPDNIDARFNLGVAFQRLDNIEEALNCYQNILQVNPDYGQAWNNLGNIHQENRELEQALTCYLKAIKSDPLNVEAINNYGLILQQQKQLKAAAEQYRNGLALSPNHRGCMNNLATVLQEMGERDEALTVLSALLEIDPENYDALTNYGNLMLELDNLIEAENAQKRAIELNPDDPKVKYNFGNLLVAKGFPGAAVDNYLDVLASQPGDVEARWNLALAYLLQGDYTNGWCHYESRMERDTGGDKNDFCLLDDTPFWDNSDSALNSPLTVLPEQGVGDVIMFTSLLPDLIKRQNAPISLACESRLVDIFQRSFTEVECVSTDEINDSTLSHKIYMGSLAKYFRRTEQDFAGTSQFILPCEHKKQHFIEKYRNLDGLKIGISWKSGNKTEGARRSIPLPQWNEIVSSSNCSIFNLQYGDTSLEVKDLREDKGIQLIDDQEVDPLKDMESFIALCSTMDLIITIDNSTAHVGGALGVSTWTLIPFNCEWRWMRDRDDTPWYPSMRLFRQPEPGDWKAVFENVHKALVEKTPSIPL